MKELKLDTVVRHNGQWCDVVKGEFRPISKKQLLRAALRKIHPQFPAIPEAQLMFAIIECAVMDLCDKEHRESALRFFSDDMPKNWIYDVLEEVDAFEQ